MPSTLPRKLLVIAVVAFSLSAGIALIGWQMTQTTGSETVALLPGELHEACFTLAPPERLEYAFKTSSPAQFNLHYHDESGVHFPVPEQLSRAEASVFVSESKQVYCLMWMNVSKEELELSLNYRLR